MAVALGVGGKTGVAGTTASVAVAELVGEDRAWLSVLFPGGEGKVCAGDITGVKTVFS
jgi:hypothetical protein